MSGPLHQRLKNERRLVGYPGRFGDRLVVLQSVPEPRPTTNPYLVQLIAALRDAGAVVHPFSWPFALLGRYDVLHVHWPENLARGRRPLTTLLRQLALLALLIRLQLTHTPLVRTVHNPTRHEQTSRREALLLRWVDRATAYMITLNSHTPTLGGVPSVTIAHGHYRDVYTHHPVQPSVPGRLAYIGLIRAYKGVEDLVSAFRQLADPTLSLTVSGQPRTAALATELVRRAGDDSRITLELAYLPDEQLVARLSAAELVVLPYRALHNSGVALAALSLNRPVLVPANPVTTDLAAEVGPGWVHTFDGELTAGALREALADLARVRRTTTPDLSGRTWVDAGLRHLAAYRAALTSRGLTRH